MTNEEKFEFLKLIELNIEYRLRYSIDLNSIVDDVRRTNEDMLNLISYLKKQIESDNRKGNRT